MDPFRLPGQKVKGDPNRIESLNPGFELGDGLSEGDDVPPLGHGNGQGKGGLPVKAHPLGGRVLVAPVDRHEVFQVDHLLPARHRDHRIKDLGHRLKISRGL